MFAKADAMRCRMCSHLAWCQQVNAWDARPQGKRGAFAKTETAYSALFTNSINSIGKSMGFKQCAYLLRSAGFGHKELLLMAAELSGWNTHSNTLGTHIAKHNILLFKNLLMAAELSGSQAAAFVSLV